MMEADPERAHNDLETAQEFEAAVRKAFIKTYGKPRHADYVERAILSSFYGKGLKLGWTESNPEVVMILTEFAWVQDPYSHDSERAKWDKVVKLLKDQGFDVAWDSVNSAVQVIFVKPEVCNHPMKTSMGADTGGQKPIAKFLIDTRASGPVICEACDAENEEGILMTDASVVCPECGAAMPMFEFLHDSVVSAVPLKRGEISTKDWHCCDDKCRSRGCSKR
jgi:hypothetical protein